MRHDRAVHLLDGLAFQLGVPAHDLHGHLFHLLVLGDHLRDFLGGQLRVADALFQGADLRVASLEFHDVLLLGLRGLLGCYPDLELRVHDLAFQPLHNLLAGLRDLDVDAVDHNDFQSLVHAGGIPGQGRQFQPYRS